MLINNFFKIHKVLNQEGNQFEIELNGTHSIFKGHFPDEPIVPGVCLIQIVKELISEMKVHEIVIYEIRNVKFLLSVNPFKSNSLIIEINISDINSNRFVVQSIIKNQDELVMKLHGEFGFYYDLL